MAKDKTKEDNLNVDDGGDAEYFPQGESSDNSLEEPSTTNYNPSGAEASNEEYQNTIKVTTEQMPELEGKQTGDTITANVDFKIDNVNDDGSYDITPVNFYSEQEEANTAEAGGMGAPTAQAGAGAPDLSKLLG